MSGLLNPIYAQKYCKPTFSSGGCNGDDISAFSFSNISISPTCNSASAVDTSGLTGTGITVYRGKTYQINVSTDNSGGTSYAVYIDYQKDGSFEDIGDYVASEINGTFTTMTQNITIPLTAKPVTTRLRVVIAPNMGSVNYNTDCGSFGNGGSEDYKLNITAYPYDIGVLALTPAYCPNAKEPVQVIIQNIGLNTLTSIPFTFKVGSTTVSSTYNRTLASNTQDTFTIGTFNASSAGTYNLQIYSTLSNDGDRSNDSITTSLHIAQPAAPTASNISHCGPGSVYLDAKSTTPKTSTYWFTTDTGQAVYKKNIDSIKTPFLPIGSSITYYAESRFATNTTITKGNWATSHTNYGNMFDVFSKNTIIVDSLDANFTGSGADSAVIYYKLGSYSGYQNDKSAWTHVATVPINIKGAPNPTRISLPRPLTLNVGTSYGFFVFAQLNEVDYDVTSLASNPFSNADMTITAGCSVGNPAAYFTGAITNGRDWEGTFYYHLNACPSPRVSTTASMIQNPNGAYLAKAAPFQGKYNLGDEVHADQICAADTNTYTIMPPTGMNESDYGTKWTVNSIKISTVRGTVLPNATVTMPTTSKNGVIQVYPTATYGDTVFVIAVDMKTPATGCDSVVIRYLNISANPVANFSFTNPCGNIPVVITDLSKVPSAIDTVKTWVWDFGDGSTVNLNRKNPYPHLYATPGTYKVSLTITSTPGCPASFSKTLQEYAVPVAKFGSKIPCNKQPISWIDSSSVASSASDVAWAWDFGDGSTSAIENPVHTYPKSGPYTVKLVTSSNQGCKDSLIKTVRVWPLAVPAPPPAPASGIRYNDNCVNVAINFSGSVLDSSANSYSLNWNYGDGSSTTKTTSHTYTANGTYTALMIVKAGNGCIDTFSQNITPYRQPVPKITYKAECVGQTVPFVDSSGSGTTAIYSWTFGDGTSANNIDSPEVYHKYAKANTYAVGLSIVSGLGCTGSGSSVIVIPGYPTAGFTANNVCIGSTTTFKNTSIGVTSPGGYAWNFGDSTFSNLPSPTHTYANVGQDSVTLTATNKYGCADNTTIVVSVNPFPVIKNWTTKVHNLTFQFLPADTTIGNFEWHFDANDSSSQRKPIFTYPTSASGKYQTVKLYVTNNFGCTSELTDSVVGKTNGIEVQGTTIDGITVFPNPFEGTTNINYTLPSKSDVKISVYDAEGKLVAKLKDGTFAAGVYTDAFDATKFHASEGVYFLKMYINNQYYTTKIVNLK